MRHPDGGLFLEQLLGLERITDDYGRESLVLHLEDSEPVCIMLNNYSNPKGAYTDAEDWLTDCMDGCMDGKWGEVPSEIEQAES